MADTGPQPREWQIDAEPFVVQEASELTQEVFKAVEILERVGGVVQIASHRREVSPKHYETVGFVFQWRSFMPAERLPQEQPEQTVAENGHGEAEQVAIEKG